MQDSGFFGLSYGQLGGSDERVFPSEPPSCSQERPKEHVVPGIEMQDSCFFGLSCDGASDLRRKRTRSESLGSLQERRKKYIVRSRRSYSELNSQVRVRPAETVEQCIPGQLTQYLPNKSMAIECQKPHQSLQRAHEPRLFTQSQSCGASDDTADLTFQEDRFARSGHAHGLAHSEDVAPRNVIEIQRSSDPSRTISSISDDDLRIRLHNEPSCFGEVEPSLNIGSRTQPASNEVFKTSDIDIEMAKSNHRRVKMESSPELMNDRDSNLSFNDWTRRGRQIHDLSKEAHELGRKQQECVLTCQRLEQRIKQGELVYGEMLRKSLELQRALETRRQHIYEDKSGLERARVSANSMGDRINAITSEIMSITADTDVSSTKRVS